MGSPPACENAQGHPSPAKQCVFTTSVATIRRGAMVVSSRIETTSFDARRRNWMMPLELSLVLRRRIQDTTSSELSGGLLLLFGQRPRHGEPYEFFFHSKAF